MVLESNPPNRVVGMSVSFQRVRKSLSIASIALLGLLATSSEMLACPFCNAVSQTLRQEMAAMDAVVIGSCLQDETEHDAETGKVRMKVERVLKGDDLVKAGDEIDAIYYGKVELGRRFMLSGVDPPDMQWSCLPVTERAETYIGMVTELPDNDLDRLRFYYQHLEDEESMLARDAYDEFAIAPYAAVKQLAPEMDHGQLVEWIRDPEMPTDRRRLYLTMLGVCGDEKDLPMLEEMLRSTTKSGRGGLDALIACYLTLGGEEALPLINELFLDNMKAPIATRTRRSWRSAFTGPKGM